MTKCRNITIDNYNKWESINRHDLQNIINRINSEKIDNNTILVKLTGVCKILLHYHLVVIYIKEIV